MYFYVIYLLLTSTLYFPNNISAGFKKSKIDTSITPQNINTNYDIIAWTNKLHLQTCAIVEIGEGFCAIFLEEISNKLPHRINEYFLGICECATISTWQLCTATLAKQRPNDCIFEYDKFQNNRVHRRLCDIMAINEWGQICNCSKMFTGHKLNDVNGFPTCFKVPLPKSMCAPRNPCGTDKCSTKTVTSGIHLLKCDRKCITKQPFCEEPKLTDSKFVQINSSWSSWNCSKCDEISDRKFYSSTAVCLNNIR